MTDPLDRAAELFRELPAPDRPPDAAVLARLATPTAHPWRRLMSRAALFAVAASVLAVAGLLVVGPSVALADVLKAAEKYTLVKYRSRFTYSGQGGKDEASREEVRFDDLRAARSRLEVRTLTLNEVVESVYTQVTDGRQDRQLAVLTETVRHLPRPDKDQQRVMDLVVGKFPRREATLRRATAAPPGQGRPQPVKPFLTWLRELEANPKAVSAREAAATRFRLEDGPRTTAVWVDRTTGLPTRLEHEELVADQNLRLTTVLAEFAWNPELPAGIGSLDELFSVAPPAGYVLTDETAKP